MRPLPQPLSAPRLQPPLPGYPLLRQMVRVSAQLGSVYGSYVQQASGAALRDREPCYVWEPNGIGLSPGTYRSRLVGSYNGPWGPLPLFAVSAACCRPAGFSSSVTPSASATPSVSASAAPSVSASAAPS